MAPDQSQPILEEVVLELTAEYEPLGEATIYKGTRAWADIHLPDFDGNIVDLFAEIKGHVAADTRFDCFIGVADTTPIIRISGDPHPDPEKFNEFVQAVENQIQDEDNQIQGEDTTG